MGIFPGTQGALTPQLEVWSSIISSQSKILWLSLLPARVGTSLSLIFLKHKAANSVVSDGILRKFKPIQAFMVVLVTCKNEEDPFKNESTRVVTTFLPL